MKEGPKSNGMSGKRYWEDSDPIRGIIYPKIEELLELI